MTCTGQIGPSAFVWPVRKERFLYFLFIFYFLYFLKKGKEGFAGGSLVKNPPASAGEASSVPGLGGSHML